MQHACQFSFLLDIPDEFETSLDTKHTQYYVSEQWDSYSDFTSIHEVLPTLALPINNDNIRITGFDTRIESDVIIQGSCNSRADFLFITVYYDTTQFADRYRINMKVLRALVQYIAEEAKRQYQELFINSFNFLSNT